MHKVLVASLFGAVVVGAGAVYVLFSKQDSSSQTTVAEPMTEAVAPVPDTQPVTGQASLEALLARAENLECSITYTPEDGLSGEVTGTYFTSNGKMRGDFIVPGLAPGSVSSMILDTNSLYSWSVIEGQSYGMKIDIAAMQSQAQNEAAPETNEPIALDTPVNYECKPWLTVDPSIFIPPSDVLFTDYASVMGAGMEYGTIYEEGESDTAAQCALCNQVAPGEGQDQCKAAFNCQ